MKRVLVTGACGFLGRNVANFFKKNGYEVIGIGHGQWQQEDPESSGIDQWIGSEINNHNLSKIKNRIDCIVHCAGGSSVGHSVTAPLLEFQRTVTSTINVLEYIRIAQPSARVVFPSSAAVYGEKDDTPIIESAPLEPVSPYGFYKKISEELCESYSKNFNLSVSVIRFFSIYGIGLKKQLLWDACSKFSAGNEEVTFFGTGKETRDWVHIEDAVSLVYMASHICERYMIVNGGSGTRITVKEILVQLKQLLGTQAEIVMNGYRKTGDPIHYWANIEKQKCFGWKPQMKIEDGLAEYVKWYIKTTNTV